MKIKAPRNRTLTLTATEQDSYQRQLLTLQHFAELPTLQNSIINQNLLACLEYLPSAFVDLLFLDPPYNLTKSFQGEIFRQQATADYELWFESWFPSLMRLLKPTASIYICADWRSSAAVQRIAERYLILRNRITWEREKGRSANRNWKNCSEDIWYCTLSNQYVFNLEAVRLRRRVLAPYTDGHGNPKDWQRTATGNYRLTAPSNLWTDLTVPFWSMPENTDHPTQKPEKLLAKVILASSQPGDWIFDPFLGSGTSAVVAKKLGRCFVGIEINSLYCCWALKRLKLAEHNQTIQGYGEGVFWERNSRL